MLYFWPQKVAKTDTFNKWK